MNCPSCGVDSELYLKQKAEEERSAKRRQEFERMYGEQLQPIKRKRAIAHSVIGGLAGFVLSCCIYSVILLGGFGTFNKFWESFRTIPPVGVLLVSLFYLIPTFFTAFMFFQYGKCTWGKQEKELRKSFGL